MPLNPRQPRRRAGSRLARLSALGYAAAVAWGAPPTEDASLSPAAIPSVVPSQICEGGRLRPLELPVTAPLQSWAAERDSALNQPLRAGRIAHGAGDIITTGERRLLVLPLTFPDAPEVPTTTASLSNACQQIEDFYLTTSRGRFRLSCEILPPLRLQRTATYYGSNPPETLRDDALRLALAQGTDVIRLADFDALRHRPIYPFHAGGTVSGRGIWLQSDDPTAAAHELGHNLGLLHANRWSDPQIATENGAHVEYGDNLDIMGGGKLETGPFNAWELAQLKWLEPDEIVAPTSSRTLRLSALGSPAGVQAVVLPSAVGREIWLEYRAQPQRFAPGLAWGPILHWSPWQSSAGGTHLLDVSPGSSVFTTYDAQDVALRPGQPFLDPATRWQVIPLGRTADTIDIRVLAPGELNAGLAPTLSLEPEVETIRAVPGQSVNFRAQASAGAQIHWDFGDGEFAGDISEITHAWTAPGWYSMTVTAVSASGESTTNYRVIEAIPGSSVTFLRGQVTAGEAGIGVGGLRVQADDGRWTYTDVNGHFRLAGLYPGVRQVRIVSAPWLASPASGRVRVRTNDLSTTNLVFSLRRPAITNIALTPAGPDLILRAGNKLALSATPALEPGAVLASFNYEVVASDTPGIRIPAKSLTELTTTLEIAPGLQTLFGLGLTTLGAESRSSPLRISGVTEAVTNHDFAHRRELSESGEPALTHTYFATTSWFVWTAPTNGFYTIYADALLNGGSSPELAAFLAPPPAAPISEDYRRITVRAESGVEVSLRLTAPSGGYHLRVHPQYAPTNDNFADRIAFTSAALGSTRAATAEPGEPQHVGEPAARSVWFKWLAERTEDRQFVVRSTGASGRHLRLAVYRASPGLDLTALTVTNLVPVAGGWDTLGFTAVAGIEYAFAVEGTAAMEDIVLVSSRSPLRDNDGYGERLELFGPEPEFTQTVTSLTREPTDPSIIPAHLGTAWWEWRCPAGGEYGLELRVPRDALDLFPPEVQLGVFTGTRPDALLPVGVLGAIGEERVRLRFFAISGETYQFALGLPVTVTGEVTGRLGPAQSNDRLERRQLLAGPHPMITGNVAPAAPGLWYEWMPERSGGVIFRAQDLEPDGTFTLPRTILVSTLNPAGLRTVPLRTEPALGPEAVVGRLEEGQAYAIYVEAGFEPRIRLQLISAPANDEFAGAEQWLATSGRVELSAGGTLEPGEPKYSEHPGTNSFWYRWQPTNGSRARWIAPGAGAQIAVYQGVTLASLTPVGLTSPTVAGPQVLVSPQPGSTYHIAVGDGAHALELLPAHANDFFADATPIPLATGRWHPDFLGSSRELGEPGHGFTNLTRTLWHTWSPAAHVGHGLRLSGDGARSVTFYQGDSLATLQLVARVRTGVPEVTERYTAFVADPGITYRVAVTEVLGTSADSSLEVRLESAPANDALAQAVLLKHPPNATPASFFGATAEPNEPATTNGTVWFRWTPEATTNVAVLWTGTHQPALAAYESDPILGLRRLASDDGSVSIRVEAGRNYWFSVAASPKDPEAVAALSFVTGAPDNDFSRVPTLPTGLTRERFVIQALAANREPGEPHHDGWSTGRSIWRSWTADSSGLMRLSLFPTSLPLSRCTLAAYRGDTLDRLQLVTARTYLPSEPGAQEPALLFPVEAGSSYYLCVDAAGPGAMEYTAELVRSAPNDRMFQALRLAPGELHFDLDPVGTFTDPDEILAIGGGGPWEGILWYRYQPTQYEQVEFEFATNAPTWRLVGFLRLPAGRLTRISLPTVGSTKNRFRHTASAGGDYYYAMSFTGVSFFNSIPAELSWRFQTVSMVENDQISHAVPLELGTNVVSTLGAGPDLSTPDFSARPTVWYEFRSTVPGDLVVTSRSLEPNVDVALALSTRAALTGAATTTPGNPVSGRWDVATAEDYRLAIATRTGATNVMVEAHFEPAVPVAKWETGIGPWFTRPGTNGWKAALTSAGRLALRAPNLRNGESSWVQWVNPGPAELLLTFRYTFSRRGTADVGVFRLESDTQSEGEVRLLLLPRVPGRATYHALPSQSGTGTFQMEDVRIFTATRTVPAVTAEFSSEGALVLTVIGDDYRQYELQWSDDLVTWATFALALGGESVTPPSFLSERNPFWVRAVW